MPTVRIAPEQAKALEEFTTALLRAHDAGRINLPPAEKARAQMARAHVQRAQAVASAEDADPIAVTQAQWDAVAPHLRHDDGERTYLVVAKGGDMALANAPAGVQYQTLGADAFAALDQPTPVSDPREGRWVQMPGEELELRRVLVGAPAEQPQPEATEA